MRHISYQDKANEMYENYKDAVKDKLENAIEHLEEIGDLLNKIDDEEFIDEVNALLAKAIQNIDEI